MKIKIPATTSNIGPGFDCLGMALSIYNEFTFLESDEFILEGFEKKYQNADNLVLKTYQFVFQKYQKPIKKVKISIDQNIPTCGGLGSSATCILAGIIGANYYLGNILSKKEILDLAIELEGHPDNVVAAFVGGLVSISCDKELFFYKYQVSKQLKFVINTPDIYINTNDARKVLPKNVDFHDAVYNISKAINIPKALCEGNFEDLQILLQDKIHEQYRITNIPYGQEYIQMCRMKGFPCTISGSGASILTICKDDTDIKEIKGPWRQIIVNVDNNGIDANGIDNEGVKL